MGILQAILGIYSYLFHGLFALFLLGISFVSLTSGSGMFRFHLLPLEGKILACWLIGLAVTGILLVLLAMKGTLRSVFFVWTLVVLALVLRGFFFSGYSFARGTTQLTTAVWMILAALLAVVGARLQVKSASSRR